jgi:hypothetical protein
METECGAGHKWRQSGNDTGHCAKCHRTFSGVLAFDKHQRFDSGLLRCLDPALVRTNDGGFWYEKVTDHLTTYWRRRRNR